MCYDIIIHRLSKNIAVFANLPVKKENCFVFLVHVGGRLCMANDGMWQAILPILRMDWAGKQ